MAHELPETITQTVWIGIPEFETQPVITAYDMSRIGWAMLGQVEVTAAVPQVDPIAKRIEALETEREQKRAEFCRCIDDLDDKIQRLQAIEHKPEEEV